MLSNLRSIELSINSFPPLHLTPKYSINMSYVNPLHPPVSSSNRSDYSSLGGAVKTSSSRRRRLPQVPWTSASKWQNATGRSGQLHNAITFDVIGYPQQGFPMRELSTRSARALGEMMQGANDQVLSHTGLAKITLRIMVSCIFP